MDYLPSVRHGQFTATPEHERNHDKDCPCIKEDLKPLTSEGADSLKSLINTLMDIRSIGAQE